MGATHASRAQALFFLGLAYRACGQPEEAIESYNRALELCPLYSDCYFNLGNLYFEGEAGEGSALDQAELCHRSALESLEESQKILAFYQLTDGGGHTDQPNMPENQAPESIVTIGRVCNMLGEISKRRNDLEAAVGYFLKGLCAEPLGHLDNYQDLAAICELLHEQELCIIVLTFVKVLTQVNEGNLDMEGESMQDESQALSSLEWANFQDAITALAA